MEETMLVQLNVSQLQSIVQDAVSNALQKLEFLKQETDEPADDILYAKDVCKLLDIQPATLYVKTSKEEIPHFKKGGRLYFSRNELQQWLINGQRLTLNEREELSHKKLLANNKHRISFS